MNQRITPDKREVSFNELWWYVLSKWRVLIVGFVIGTVVMAAIASMVNLYSGNKVVFMDEEDIRASLTQEQLAEVDRTVELYEEYQDSVDVNKNSYIMKLNAGMSYRYNCQFYVAADTVEATENLMELLKARVKGEQVVDAIAALNIFGMDESDMDGIITAAYVGGVLDISIYGKENDVKAIGDIVSNELKTYSKELQTLVGKFELSMLNESVSKANSSQIREIQEYRKADMKYMQTALNEKVAALSYNQKSIYDIEIGVNTAGSNAAIINSVKRMNAVHVVLGAVMAVMIMVVVAIIRFLTGPKLRSINEVEQVYNMEILGKIISEKNSKGLDKIFALKRHHYNGLDNSDDQIEYIANAIAKQCMAKEYNRINLCCCDGTEANIKDKLVKALNNKGIACDLLKNLVWETDAVNKMVNDKNTIIIGQIDVTKKRILEEEIGLCDKLEANLMGMLMLI